MIRWVAASRRHFCVLFHIRGSENRARAWQSSRWRCEQCCVRWLDNRRRIESTFKGAHWPHRRDQSSVSINLFFCYRIKVWPIAVVLVPQSLSVLVSFQLVASLFSRDWHFTCLAAKSEHGGEEILYWTSRQSYLFCYLKERVREWLSPTLSLVLWSLPKPAHAIGPISIDY